MAKERPSERRARPLNESSEYAPHLRLPDRLRDRERAEVHRHVDEGVHHDSFGPARRCPTATPISR